jgi:hypothetical protein
MNMRFVGNATEKLLGKVALTVTSAFFLAVAFSFGPSADAQTAPSRVIDRTLRCTIFVTAGVRQIELSANSAAPQYGPAAAAESYGLPNTVYGGLAAVSSGGLTHNSSRCTPVRARVPLTPAGLEGGRASPFEDEFDCAASRHVLVRVRAVFREPASLRLDWTDSTRRHKHMTARGSVRTGAFAVRTETGRPIAYADILASGRARLFTGRGCFPD